ncbi:MAG: pyridoxal phosphate-dependent aminotransferase family protein [Bacteroidetes bacterium]|nr:pyridoxal phosphate-dependent aminotransferase family protein [Bacteroidota bacterium]
MSRSNHSAARFLSDALNKRKEQNALRKLIDNSELIDLCSNDYLGFARSKFLYRNIEKEYSSLNCIRNGSGGSRLLAGNSDYCENLETFIADFHGAPAGLIYNSGYDANVGLFSSVARKGDTIIYDELIHASVHDGMKLSGATTYPFKHNDLEHLEARLKIASGLIYVAVESVYSMDGDEALLKQIVSLCKQYNAALIVDEAHATGITCNAGKGKVQELKLEKEVFARVHTFGKALGCHGAIVLGSKDLRNFLINFSRSFIYTTALPLKSLVAIHQSYLLLAESQKTILKLHALIDSFGKGLSDEGRAQLIKSSSPIQCVIVSGNVNVKALANTLQDKGFDVRPILNPTVPKGKERLRICIHAFNTAQELQGICKAINSYFEKKMIAK